ncbi:MAG: hypothetical protein ACRD0J_17605 [Acidimicrobiales bacterium]
MTGEPTDLRKRRDAAWARLGFPVADLRGFGFQGGDRRYPQLVRCVQELERRAIEHYGDRQRAHAALDAVLAEYEFRDDRETKAARLLASRAVAARDRVDAESLG